MRYGAAECDFAHVKGKHFICPDFGKGGLVHLEKSGNLDEEKRTFQMQISRCIDDSEEGRNCADSKSIDDFADRLTVRFHSWESSIDWAVRDPAKRPVSRIHREFGAVALKHGKLVDAQTLMNYNYIESYSGLSGMLGAAAYEGSFYSMARTSSFETLPPSSDKAILYRNTIVLDNQQIHHVRSMHGWLDLLADFGGVVGLL